MLSSRPWGEIFSEFSEIVLDRSLTLFEMTMSLIISLKLTAVASKDNHNKEAEYKLRLENTTGRETETRRGYRLAAPFQIKSIIFR